MFSPEFVAVGGHRSMVTVLSEVYPKLETHITQNPVQASIPAVCFWSFLV